MAKSYDFDAWLSGWVLQRIHTTDFPTRIYLFANLIIQSFGIDIRSNRTDMHCSSILVFMSIPIFFLNLQVNLPLPYTSPAQRRKVTTLNFLIRACTSILASLKCNTAVIDRFMMSGRFQKKVSEISGKYQGIRRSE